MPTIKYRVIKGKGLIFWGDNMGNCEKISSYEHGSNSEWLPS